MDPLSIVVSSASLAEFCGKVSILIYDFIDGSANVDYNLAGMKREVEGLGRVLDAIGHSKVGSSDIEAASRDSGRELVSSLHESLWDCRGSLEKLAEALASFNKPRSLLWSSRPGRQIRLSLKAKDIAQYRQQIKSHTQDMQLSLGVISIANSDEILQSLHNLEAQIGGTSRARPGTHRKQLVDAAESICSNASVIVGRSTTSSHYNPSIHGERLSETKKEGILGWIPPPISEDTESFDRSRTAVDDSDETDIDNEGTEDTAARLMLAISQASIGKWQEVDQSVLLPEACPSYDPVAVHHYFHLLHAAALHHLAQEEATTAFELCRRAVKGKKTFFGKSTDSYNYSLALLSAISISLGDRVSAEVYREMLPTGKVYELFFEAPGMAIPKYIDWALGSGPLPEGEFFARVKDFVHKKVCAIEGLKGHVPYESYLAWPFELREMGQGVQDAYTRLLKDIPHTVTISLYGAVLAYNNYSRCLGLRKGSYILSLSFEAGGATATVFRVVGTRPFLVEQIDHTRVLVYGELILRDAKKRDRLSAEGSAGSEPEHYDIKFPLHSPDLIDNSTQIECDISGVKSTQPANELGQIFQFLNNIVRPLPGTTEASNVIHFGWSNSLHYPIQKHVHRYIHEMQAAGLNARLVSHLPRASEKFYNVPGVASHAFAAVYSNIPPPPEPTAPDELTARWDVCSDCWHGKIEAPTATQTH
ncbi:hypothetical protein B0T26DRAFT_752863 [Lasiosphaeria miniovina]|uniref:Fungal N-terminal domain-containing protein n=1 Tax=Lasiosphaeria miniovina TaxID=1954250 RepID=A0AA40AB56_9PEZI|nr:uncharacterized protein B0T26DRAFT_752863 [Lasiosphaeria miniovina]KAK0712658.1 hypothetical protein B0T26DRAFT_752863 [Lasiosphaeria miniovina]